IHNWRSFVMKSLYSLLYKVFQKHFQNAIDYILLLEVFLILLKRINPSGMNSNRKNITGNERCVNAWGVSAIIRRCDYDSTSEQLVSLLTIRSLCEYRGNC
ncbi:hypothetical protein, partial [Enterobacter cloacae complex sp. 4DZ3-17B2]|uniref:hypothetical protein n=1 Tax=Enterobacter cloacae complex sp. 4DZ3-17B2 TaxID=2511990 RepID=UPI001CA5289A